MVLTDELKKGTTPMLILSLLEAEPRHGYELSKLLEQKTRGVVRVHAASLYPLLYRLEKRHLIEGRWVEKTGERRRRFYRLTAEGKRQLEAQRQSWIEFARAIGHVAGVEHA
jgi:transcriptional regulator